MKYQPKSQDAPNLTPDEARAVIRSMRRNHPFFAPGGGAFGHDMRTFRILYPYGAFIFGCAMLASGDYV